MRSFIHDNKNEYHDNHYAEMKIQPIDICQSCQSHEAFVGGLFFNIVKYHKRAGHKIGESRQKDEEKRNRYIAWYIHARRGEHIDPRKECFASEYEIQRVCEKIDKHERELSIEKTLTERKL